MKFAIKFYQGCRTLPQADEIIIKYKEKSSSLIDFVQKWEDNQRVIADITRLDNIEASLDIFKEARRLHKEFAVIMSYNQFFVDLAENNIPYFFIEGVNSYDDLNSQISLGVSDVYILNELCFDLERISFFCHENNVKVRVYPNVCQTSSKTYNDTFRQFFIRPDAVALYEPYIDVLEFFGPLDRQPVLYDIYKDERWLGMLDEVIIGLDKRINNQTIMPYFDTMRLKCRKKCAFNKCDICEVIGSLGHALEEKQVGLKKRKAKHNEFKVNEEAVQNESATAIKGAL